MIYKHFVIITVNDCIRVQTETNPTEQAFKVFPGTDIETIKIAKKWIDEFWAKSGHLHQI